MNKKRLVPKRSTEPTEPTKKAEPPPPEWIVEAVRDAHTINLIRLHLVRSETAAADGRPRLPWRRELACVPYLGDPAPMFLGQLRFVAQVAARAVYTATNQPVAIDLHSVDECCQNAVQQFEHAAARAPLGAKGERLLPVQADGGIPTPERRAEIDRQEALRQKETGRQDAVRAAAAEASGEPAEPGRRGSGSRLILPADL